MIRTTVFPALALAATAALPLAPLPAQWTAATLRSDDGGTAGRMFGESIALVGDLDRDSVADYLVGVPSQRTGTLTIGTVVAFSGRDGRLLYQIFGPRDDGRFGAALAGIGDVDGDGTSDWLAGAPNDRTAGTDAGSVSCYSGRTGGLLWRRNGAANSLFGASLAAVFHPAPSHPAGSFLVGAPGNGSTQSGFMLCAAVDGRVIDSRTAPAHHRLGTSVAAAVGAPFGAAGAPFSGPQQEGSVRFVSISNTRMADQATYLSFDAQAHMGTSITSFVARDLSYQWAIGGPGNASIAGRVDFVTADFSSARRIASLIGLARSDRFGQALSGGGDLDGDGWADLLVGAPGDNLFGTDAGSYQLISGLGLVRRARVSRSVGERRGQAVAFLRDYDGDGFPEFAVGVPGADPGGRIDSGQVQVLSINHPGVLQNYGAGCSTATLGADPTGLRPGGTTVLRARALPATGTQGVWVLGFGQRSLDLSAIGMPGCFLHTDQSITFPLATTTAEAHLDIPLPPQRALLFQSFSAQFVVAEPGANTLGLVSSQGLRITLGNR